MKLSKTSCGFVSGQAKSGGSAGVQTLERIGVSLGKRTIATGPGVPIPRRQ